MIAGFPSQLFGVGLAVIGMVVLAFSGRYVWRTTGIYGAEAVSTLGDVFPTHRSYLWNGPRGRRGPLSAFQQERLSCPPVRRRRTSSESGLVLVRDDTRAGGLGYVPPADIRKPKSILPNRHTP